MDMKYKPGDIIDLSKFNKPKSEALNRKTIRENAIEQINLIKKKNIKYIQSLFIKTNAPDSFIDNNGAINSEIFKKSNGGYISDENVNYEKKAVFTRNEQSFHKNERKDGFLAEKVMLILLNKLFKNSDFVIVDSNSHDDHENGIDQVIINIRTGETICALDDFVSNDELIKNRPEKEKYYYNKIERFINKKTNGAQLKYGAVFENGKFQKLSKLEKLPIAVLRVERDLFYKAMRDMDFSIESELDVSEIRLLKYISYSLEEQISNLSENMNVSYDSVYNLIDFFNKKLYRNI